MEAKQVHALALTRFSNQDAMHKMETSYKNLIQTVTNTIGSDLVVGIIDLPTKFRCSFKNLSSVAFAKLNQIYILGAQINKIVLLFNTKELVIEVKKQSYKPTIKRRKIIGIKNIDSIVQTFLEKDNVLTKSDHRIASEILKLILKWSWGQLAAEIAIEKNGGAYEFTVKKLLNLSFVQLSALQKIHESIHDIDVNLHKKELRFNVTCTDEYITLQNTSKKARYG